MNFYLVENTLAVDASWTGVNEATVEWQTSARVKLFKVYTRKIVYNVFGNPMYGKWKKAGVVKKTTGEVVDGSEDKAAIEERTAVTFNINQRYSWEVRIVVWNDNNNNKTAGIFFDPPMAKALGKLTMITDTDRNYYDNKQYKSKNNNIDS